MTNAIYTPQQEFVRRFVQITEEYDDDHDYWDDQLMVLAAQMQDEALENNGGESLDVLIPWIKNEIVDKIRALGMSGESREEDHENYDRYVDNIFEDAPRYTNHMIVAPTEAPKDESDPETWGAVQNLLWMVGCYRRYVGKELDIDTILARLKVAYEKDIQKSWNAL